MKYPDNEDIYESENINTYVDDDEMSSEEAAFMKGYDKAEGSKKKKKTESDIFEDIEDERPKEEEE